MSKNSIPARVKKFCKILEAGDYTKVEKKLLSHKKYYDKYLSMFMALSVIKQDRSMIQLLIKHGASINLSYKMEGEAATAPLSRAVRLNNIDFVNYLMQNGAEANNSALFRAIDTGNLEMIKLLVNHGARPKEIFSYEKTANSPEVLKYLYLNIDVTDASLVTFTFEKYKSILFTADNMPDLALFFKKCHDSSRYDRDYKNIMFEVSKTVCYSARTVNDLFNLKKALSLGIEINTGYVSEAQDRIVRAALKGIKSDRDIKLLYDLIENEIPIKSDFIRELLSDIILNDDIEMLLNRIIELGDNKESGEWMSGALLKAIENGKYDRVKLLVEKGADINVHLHYENEPIYIALKYYNPDIIIYLIERGANLLNIGPYDESAVEIMSNMITEHKSVNRYSETYNEMLDYIKAAQEKQYKEHSWNGCICTDSRLEYHDWDACTCRRCGAKRRHKVDKDCKCIRCNAISHDCHWEVSHDDQYNIYICKRCGTVTDTDYYR